MTSSLLPTRLLITAFTSPAFAQSNPHQHDHPTADRTGVDVHVSAAATEAVATVERFSAALSCGDLAKASKEPDPSVLIFEGGGAERSAAEYLDGHAKSDAELLSTAHQQLRRRSAHASGDFAWMASEVELHLQEDGKPVTVLSTETLLLQRIASGWKVGHIHWSSRKKEPSPAH